MLREEAIKRIMERDGKTRAEAEKRIDSQITNSQRAQARQDNITFSPTVCNMHLGIRIRIPIGSGYVPYCRILDDCSGYGSKFVQIVVLTLVRCTYSLSLILIVELLLGSVPDPDP